MKIPSWDELFMRHVFLISTKSKDFSTQVGTVLVREKRVIGEGYNGICSGVNDTIKDRQEGPNKVFFWEHSERNAVLTCAKFGISTNGAICYTSGVSCADCARALIQAGITEVVFNKRWGLAFLDQPIRKEWDAGCDHSLVMFDEAGVKVREFDGFLGIKTLIRGREVEI